MVFAFHAFAEIDWGNSLSRNKEYIVIYRGNDLLPPVSHQNPD